MTDRVPHRGALLVAGTGSDVGKSVVVQGLCRWLARNGVRVAPFKAQNMSLNSDVTPEGAEIARAQSAQAAAAMAIPEAAMNPVLLKPVDDTRAQVIVMGKAVCDSDAREYLELRPRLMRIALDAFDDLRTRFEVVICEGAGSLAEMNLRSGDLANMGIARAAGLPVVAVGDVDRGGVFASLYGSVGLLDPADRSMLAGFVINKFRGDHSILEPGLRTIETLTGLPVLGVLPWVKGLWMDAEDAVPFAAMRAGSALPAGRDALDVAVVALPRMSNFTDVDPIAHEPGITVRFTRSHADLLRADLVIIPGTKATVSDLADLRAARLDETIVERARRGKATIGICGGYQMLGKRIADPVESGERDVTGLGLLDVETTFEAEKILALRRGTTPRFDGASVEGYEIHHGRVARRAGAPLIETEAGAEGCFDGPVIGTSLHGIFTSDAFRRSLLRWVAVQEGVDWRPGSVGFAEARESTFERLADLIEANLDTTAVLELIERASSSHQRVRG